MVMRPACRWGHTTKDGIVPHVPTQVCSSPDPDSRLDRTGWLSWNPGSGGAGPLTGHVAAPAPVASRRLPQLCLEILSYLPADTAKAEMISHTLNAGYPSHGYTITLRKACKIDLNVGTLPDAQNRLCSN